VRKAEVTREAAPKPESVITASIRDYEERTRLAEKVSGPAAPEVPETIRDILLAPVATKPTSTLEKITPLQTKPEAPMSMTLSEQDHPRTVLTLPEPVMPTRMAPYVEELLTTPRFEPAPLEHEPIGLNEVPNALAQELSTPIVKAAEDIDAELSAILNDEPSFPTIEVEPATLLHGPEREPTPLETFSYFAEGLTAWHEEPASTTEAAGVTPESPIQTIEQIDDLPESDKKAMIAISQEVADRLNDLEPTKIDEIAPVIAEITATATKIQELSTSDLAEDSVILEEAKEQLEELCQELFEALGIEYDEASIKYFVQVILLKQFKDSMTVAMDKDRMGTHEFKHRFPAFGAIAQNIAGEVFHFMLGRLALVQANPSERLVVNA
jgi:hypothetical protein